MSSPSWPYYLPVNPCCTPTTPCATPSCCPDPCSNCSSGDPCADPCHIIGRRTDDFAYNGTNLPCTEIDECDTLTVVLQKIEEKICILQGLLIPTTTTTGILFKLSTNDTGRHVKYGTDSYSARAYRIVGAELEKYARGIVTGKQIGRAHV